MTVHGPGKVVDRWSGVDSEECEWSGEVACGRAERGGDVGVACQPQGADGEVAEADHDAWRGAGAHSGGVLTVGDVANVVEPVLDAPVVADELGDRGGSARSPGRLVMPSAATALVGFPARSVT